MSRIFKSAALAVWFGVVSPTLADGIPAAITPPLPMAFLSSPEIPQDSDATLARFAAAPAKFTEKTDPIADIVARQAHISSFGTACGPSLSVKAAPNAMLAVQVVAPCLPYDAVRFEHEDLDFTIPMPLTGKLSFLMPVLEENATLSAILSDGTTLNAVAHVPDTRNYARVALQWRGADPGQLVAKTPRLLKGEVTHLGQSVDANGAVLQVFSSLINDQTASGVVRLSMRTNVTAANCGSDQVARVRRVVPGEPVSDYGLAIKGLGCGAIGQSLELKNVLQDLKLAGN